MSFQISALPLSSFEHLFALDDRQLALHRAVRKTATKQPGFPCRVSLQDAAVGEEVILVHYEHHAVASPFAASHAVYVRPGAAQAHPQANEVPLQLRSRTLSVRAFNSNAMMIEAELTEGAELETAVARLFENPEAAYLHIHYAKPGCYAALATRVR